MNEVMYSMGRNMLQRRHTSGTHCTIFMNATVLPSHSPVGVSNDTSPVSAPCYVFL